MIIMVDIDGTICITPLDANGKQDYVNAAPIKERIVYLNRFYDEGHTMKYWTARGTSSGLDWFELTVNQLNEWGVKYHSIAIGKPSYDVWIDDKAINANEMLDWDDWK